MHKTQNRRDQQQRRGNTRCGAVDVRFGGESFASVALKLLPTRASEMRRNSGMCARGITWSQLILQRNIYALEFRFMETARVVPTRSGSCSRVDGSRIGDYGHAVFGANVLHVVPADFAIDNSIHNFDSVVANHNFGSDINQVRQTAECGRPSERAQDVVQVSTCGLPNHAERNENHKAEKVITTLRSENFHIAHKSQTTRTIRCIADHEEVAA